MKTIFISYRRSDSSGQAGRIRDRFVQHFGKEKVFFDVGSIGPGNWREQLNNALENCSVMVVIIGDEWFEKAKGVSRLQNSDDPVRLEIEAGLKRNVVVIPTLVDKAQLGDELKDQLPETLQTLLDQQVFEVRHEHFDDDINRLLNQVEATLPVNRRRKVWQLAMRSVALATVAATAFVVIKYLNDGCNSTSTSTLTSDSTFLSGRVQTVTGKSVEGAQLRVAERPDTVVTTTTDGRFYFASVPRKAGDTVGLTITKPGFVSKTLRVALGNDAQVVFEELPKFTKTIQIKPRMPEGSDLVNGTILMSDGGGRKVAEITNWNERDLTFTLTKGEYSLKVDLRYRTPSGLFRRCEDTREIAFSNNKLVIITPDCR